MHPGTYTPKGFHLMRFTCPQRSANEPQELHRLNSSSTVSRCSTRIHSGSPRRKKSSRISGRKPIERTWQESTWTQYASERVCLWRGRSSSTQRSSVRSRSSATFADMFQTHSHGPCYCSQFLPAAGDTCFFLRSHGPINAVLLPVHSRMQKGTDM